MRTHFIQVDEDEMSEWIVLWFGFNLLHGYDNNWWISLWYERSEQNETSFPPIFCAPINWFKWEEMEHHVRLLWWMNVYINIQAFSPLKTICLIFDSTFYKNRELCLVLFSDLTFPLAKIQNRMFWWWNTFSTISTRTKKRGFSALLPHFIYRLLLL